MWGDDTWHVYHQHNDPAERTPLEANMHDELAELIALYEGHADPWEIQGVRDDWNPQNTNLNLFPA